MSRLSNQSNTTLRPESERIHDPNHAGYSIDSEKSGENLDQNEDVEKQRNGNNDEQQQQPEKEKEGKNPNLIEWSGPEDPENPMNWPKSKKWIVTMTFGMMTFCITFASSVFSTATMATAALFGVSAEVMTLGTSLFVLGFAVGPIVW